MGAASCDAARPAIPLRGGAPSPMAPVARILAAVDPRELLEVAIAEARAGLAEGGIPIGAALFTADGELLGSGHNRRVQEGDPSLHGETDAFRRAGRRRSYRDTVMVTTLAPCWYCSGLVRQFGIPAGRRRRVRQLRGRRGLAARERRRGRRPRARECIDLLGGFIAAHPELWHEDIGED